MKSWLALRYSTTRQHFDGQRIYDLKIREATYLLAQRVRGKAWRSEGGSNGMYYMYGRYFSNQVVVGEKANHRIQPSN